MLNAGRGEIRRSGLGQSLHRRTQQAAAFQAAGELLPIGKAYFGFTDAELTEIDKWVRHHTIQQFGPVREVDKHLVFEVAFDAVQRSKRHKSGFALRFPRISRIRWDKPAAEADQLDILERLAPV